MIQTYRSVHVVLNVAQAGTLVVCKFTLVILLTNAILNMNFLLPRFVGVDDIVQHQHTVRRLTLPRIRPGVHARTDATYERLELGCLEWRLVVDALDHVRRE